MVVEGPGGRRALLCEPALSAAKKGSQRKELCRLRVLWVRVETLDTVLTVVV